MVFFLRFCSKNLLLKKEADLVHNDEPYISHAWSTYKTLKNMENKKKRKMKIKRVRIDLPKKSVNAEAISRMVL